MAQHVALDVDRLDIGATEVEVQHPDDETNETHRRPVVEMFVGSHLRDGARLVGMRPEKCRARAFRRKERHAEHEHERDEHTGRHLGP